MFSALIGGGGRRSQLVGRGILIRGNSGGKVVAFDTDQAIGRLEEVGFQRAQVKEERIDPLVLWARWPGR